MGRMRYFYDLGHYNAYYGLSTDWIVKMTMLDADLRSCYLNGYADYCESFV